MKDIEFILSCLITKNTRENKQYCKKHNIYLNDILDYYITKNNSQVNVHYTYYPNCKDEKNFINSKIIILDNFV